MADTEPGNTEPRSTEPGNTELRSTEPGSIEPGSTEPEAADGEDGPPGPPASDDESGTGGAGGNRDAEGEAEATRRTRRRTRIRRTAVAVLLVLLVPLLTAETALRVNYMGDPADGTHTRNRDAMWLGHAWVDGRKDDADLAAFARRVKATGIRDLYVHTGPMEHDGTLPKSLYPDRKSVV